MPKEIAPGCPRSNLSFERRKTVEKFRKLIFRIVDFSAYISNFCIAVNMLIVVASVIGRVLFHSAILGVTDIAGYAFGMSVVFAFCVTEKDNSHVRMDLLLNVLPRRGQIVDHVIVGILNLIMITLIMLIFIRDTLVTFESGMSSWVLSIPYYPFVAAAVIGVLLYLVTAIVNFITAFDQWKVKTTEVSA
jgi:TRAP-type C4-dicarboxylate transport system permease small subunit